MSISKTKGKWLKMHYSDIQLNSEDKIAQNIKIQGSVNRVPTSNRYPTGSGGGKEIKDQSITKV